MTDDQARIDDELNKRLADLTAAERKQQRLGVDGRDVVDG